jgi:hypothetical protein
MDRLGWPLNWWPLLMSTASAVFSGAHLAAILFPRKLRRLYIARDNDAAGDGAVDNLIDRSREAGTEAITLSSHLGDFNEDLRAFGIDALRAAIRVQIVPEDVVRFMALEEAVTGAAAVYGGAGVMSHRVAGSYHQWSERTAPTAF